MTLTRNTASCIQSFIILLLTFNLASLRVEEVEDTDLNGCTV